MSGAFSEANIVDFLGHQELRKFQRGCCRYNLHLPPTMLSIVLQSSNSNIQNKFEDALLWLICLGEESEKNVRVYFF